eukprot:CAMPEP_0113585214 /NCGR_PEP_ID=MMETSP0015_2-20120614/33557_1 /TAXON_ID=2838 /ORGANISM="Odontella" /LENGTH=82 /DNA_ID=CAMNT_0000490395 /DNA_START=87 /DNA_END=332 /DNA_ORIENTATION=+ /assembly_acc=CAM_ASM_000160
MGKKSKKLSSTSVSPAAAVDPSLVAASSPYEDPAAPAPSQKSRRGKREQDDNAAAAKLRASWPGVVVWLLVFVTLQLGMQWA